MGQRFEKFDVLNGVFTVQPFEDPPPFKAIDIPRFAAVCDGIHGDQMARAGDRPGQSDAHQAAVDKVNILRKMVSFAQYLNDTDPESLIRIQGASDAE